MASASKAGDEELLRTLDTRMEELRSKVDEALVQKVEANVLGYLKHHFEGNNEPATTNLVAELREELLDLAQQLADHKIDLLARDRAGQAI
jgi:hypothetical protein